MTRTWKIFCLAVLMVTIFAACNRIEPIYNIENEAVPQEAQHNLSSDKIGTMIANTAFEKGWQVTRLKPGLLRCTLRWQDYAATIKIQYSKKDYSIVLESSENLKESEGMIHPKYNKLVKQLQAEIDKRLSLVAFK